MRLDRHNARLAARDERRRAHLAKVHANHLARLAKLQAQHEAIRSRNVVRTAYAFRGSRYVFGGTSRSGFDCSGFTRFVVGKSAGVALPRTASEQYENGKPVRAGQMKPGDLVFFKNTYRHGISHVGIYAGDGKFVHAANTSKGVTVSNLDEPYYEHRFAGARRVIHHN